MFEVFLELRESSNMDQHRFLHAKNLINQLEIIIKEEELLKVQLMAFSNNFARAEAFDWLVKFFVVSLEIVKQN